MNRTQLKVLWVGIGIFVLMGLFPPSTRGGYHFILDKSNVSISRLCIQWAIVTVITGGFICSLKVDPDLILKIPCFFFSFFGGCLYGEVLEETRNKKDKANVKCFWVILLALLILALIIVGLSVPEETIRKVIS